MLRRASNAIPFFEFGVLQEFKRGLTHAVFTRHSDIRDPSTIQSALETKATPRSFGDQLHGNKVIRVRAVEKQIENGDALITDQPNIPLVIRIADCASIILFEPSKKIIGNIHAGWHGIAQRIIQATIDRLIKDFNVPITELRVCISPMIGPCCCRFTEPKKELPKFLHSFITEENTVDLWSAIEGQLRECGVKKEYIENPRICTACNPEEFFSYRREGNTGRFGTAIMLK